MLVKVTEEGFDQIRRLARFYETSPGDVVRGLVARHWDEIKEKVCSLERVREQYAAPLAKAGSGGSSSGDR